MKPGLAEKYQKKIVPELMKSLHLSNSMQVPRLQKIVVSMCLKEATTDMKALDRASEEVGLITGQRPKITRAKKSIAAFKLRQGVPLGCVATLRGNRMYEFMGRFTNIALPRVRDFRGISPGGFDGRGNYSMGIKEQIIFPEINYDKVDKIRGMNVTFVTTASDDKKGYELLERLGIPFRKK